MAELLSFFSWPQAFFQLSFYHLGRLDDRLGNAPKRPPFYARIKVSRLQLTKPLVEDMIMTKELKENCAAAFRAFEKSFLAMKLSPVRYRIAYQLLQEAREELIDGNHLEGAAFALKLRYFYTRFCVEFAPGGIVLSDEARKAFSRISDLANSREVNKQWTHPF